MKQTQLLIAMIVTLILASPAHAEYLSNEEILSPNLSAQTENATPPSLEFVTSFGGRINGWIKTGNVLYLMQGSVLRTIDMTDPDHPCERNTLDLGWIIDDFAYNPPALYLSTRSFGEYVSNFVMIDLSDPWKPKIAPSTVSFQQTHVTKLSLQGHYLFVEGYVYDVGEPLTPRKVGREQSFKVPKNQNGSKPSGFLTSKDSSTIKSPSSFTHPWTGLQNARALVVKNGYVFLLCNDSLQVVDVHDPVRPRRQGQFELPANGLDITIYGTLALVTDENAGLNIIDISDPTTPILRACGVLPGNGYALDASENLVCVAIGPAASHDNETASPDMTGMQIVDLTDPVHPRLAGFYETLCRDVVISGDLAYLASGNLEIIDVSNPDAPTRIGISQPPNDPKLPVDENRIEYDFDAEKPDIYGATADLNLIGNHVITMGPLVFHEAKDHSFGIINIFNVINPEKPAWSGAMSQGQYFKARVAADMIYAFSRHSSTGNNTHILGLFRFAEQGTGERLAANICFQLPEDIEVEGPMVYAVDGEYGLVILRRKSGPLP